MFVNFFYCCNLDICSRFLVYEYCVGLVYFVDIMVEGLCVVLIMCYDKFFNILIIDFNMK